MTTSNVLVEVRQPDDQMGMLIKFEYSMFWFLPARSWIDGLLAVGAKRRVTCPGFVIAITPYDMINAQFPY
jgi:hypothetical protein